MARDARGFTLIELMVASVVLLIVAAAAMPIVLAGQRQQSGQESRVDSLDRARDAMERITREGHEAARIELPAAGVVGQVLTMRVPTSSATGSVLRLVRYDCSHTSTLGAGLRYCTREQETGAGTGTYGAPLKIVDGISNTDVFTSATGSPSRSVTVKLEQRVEDSPNPVTLIEAVAIRNCTTSGLSLTPCA